VSLVEEVVGPRGDRHRHLGTAGSLTNSRPVCDDRRRHLVNRYYDPASYQFLSIDPKVASTMQPYAFVGGDPLNESDPLGLRPTGPGNCVGGRRSCERRVRRYQASVRRFERQETRFLTSVGHYVAKHRTGIIQVVGAVAAVTAIAATGGAAAVVGTALEASAGAIETTATVATVASAAADGYGCATGSGASQAAACAGAATGGFGAIGGLVLKGVVQAAEVGSFATNAKVVCAGTVGLGAGLSDWVSAVNGSNQDG
jgi:hypothetical protein